jgi:hypothetical protein
MASAKRIRAKAEKLGLVTPQMERVRYVPARTGPEASAALAALASGAFDPAVQAASGGAGENAASVTPEGSGADATSTAGADIAPEDAEAMLSDGDPSNDTQAMLSDGDPSNDADALLNDGDPSNDAGALLDDGDPSNDGEVASAQGAADVE